ncbi:MAG: type I glutamate--ammonia ligase, partial [Oscillospiraceae bacterium]|nr:type I glutamate--ammonia ligase [Oscillospiraceae bacterium]
FRLYDDPAEEGLTLRAADCVCDPYYVFGLMIAAALEGIEEALPLPPEKSGTETLPHDLGEAVDCAAQSAFLAAHVPPAVLDSLLTRRRAAWEQHEKSTT